MHPPRHKFTLILKRLVLFCVVLALLIALVPLFKKQLAYALFGGKHHGFTQISPGDHDPRKTDQDLTHLLHQLNHSGAAVHRLNDKIAFMAKYFENRPTRLTHIEGEGDLCPNSSDRHGCPHVQQDPIYRTDFFACNTLVQLVLALLYAENLQAFKKLILKVEYGAAGETEKSIHYYNRNNFISGDFNPVNEKHGFIVDATRSVPYSDTVKTITVTLDRAKWFAKQLQKENVDQTVRVLSSQSGRSMLWRAMSYYPQRVHYFKPQVITVDYIPKEIFSQGMALDGTYRIDREKINALPTPSILEIVRDPSRWKAQGRLVSDVTGSQIAISHLGLLYRQSFERGEVIYQKITCTREASSKTCQVTPVTCDIAQGCIEVMIVQATSAYPEDYVYYQDSAGQYHCESHAPEGVSATTCNRVVAMPLREYLFLYEYGHYIFMEEPSIVGLHLEHIQNKHHKRTS